MNKMLTSLFNSKFAGADVAEAEISTGHWNWVQSRPSNPDAAKEMRGLFLQAGQAECKEHPLVHE